MAIRISVHRGLWQAMALVSVAVVFTIALAALAGRVGRRKPDAVDSPSMRGRPAFSAVAVESSLLIPILRLCVPDDALEAAWTNELARLLRGQTEVVVSHGRVDVLAPGFALEVDRLQKWHEGIGQSLHYAQATHRRPALALIIPMEPGLEAASVQELVSQIDRICSEQGIRLVLLESGCSE